MADTKIVMSAHQAFTNMRSGIPAIISATEALLKAGAIAGVTKTSIEKTKTKGFKDFVAKYKLPIVEGTTRGGGTRGGILATALELAKGDANAPIVKLANQMKALNDAVIAELKKFGRELSPGYIRGKADEEAPAVTK